MSVQILPPGSSTAVRHVVLHMRNGETVSYSPTVVEVASLTAAVERRGLDGTITINDGEDARRIVNMAAIDFIEVKAAQP